MYAAATGYGSSLLKDEYFSKEESEAYFEEKASTGSDDNRNWGGKVRTTGGVVVQGDRSAGRDQITTNINNYGVNHLTPEQQTQKKLNECLDAVDFPQREDQQV